MIVDSSAIMAILLQEQEAAAVVRAISIAEQCSLSAAGYVEIGIVYDSRNGSGSEAEYDDVLAELGVSIEPVTEIQAKIARKAYRDFGKGSGHPAKLNFGDCFAYALATETGRPLLYKGDDFVHAGFERLV